MDVQHYYHFTEVFDQGCPFPIGWLINRGVCLPLSQQVSMMIDGIPAPRPSIFTKRTLLFLMFSMIYPLQDYHVHCICVRDRFSKDREDGMWTVRGQGETCPLVLFVGAQFSQRSIIDF